MPVNNDRLDQLAQMLTIVDQDIAEIRDREPTESSKRNIVRTIFASIEGLTSAVKSFILFYHENQLHSFDNGTVAILLEHSYHLDPHGVVRSKPYYAPLLAHIRFTFSLFARIHNVEFTVTMLDDDTHALSEAIRVRNRLMHPKSPRDLSVAASDLRVVISAFLWFRAEFNRLLELTRREGYGVTLDGRILRPDDARTPNAKAIRGASD